MNYIKLLALSLVVSIPLATGAVLLQPFGGRIGTAPTPGVECPAGKQPGSPFTVIPVMPTASWLMVGDYHPISLPFQLVPGAWILGLYNPVPIPECVTTTVPPAPVSGFRTYFHGTSVLIP